MNTTRAVITVLAVGLLLDVYRLVFAITSRETPEVLVAVPHATIHFLVRIATIVLFFVWLDHMWGNVAALSGGSLPSRATMLLSFLVPPLCFVRPVQILTEVWDGSAPRREERRSWFARLAVAWWVAFLIPPILVLTAIRRQDVSPFETWLRIVVSESMNIVAAMLAIAIVHLISHRQQELHRSRKAPARTTSAPPPVPKPSDAVVAEPVTRDEPVVTIAPIQPMAGLTARRRPSLEMMIRAQALRRRSLREALSALRNLLTRAARR